MAFWVWSIIVGILTFLILKFYAIKNRFKKWGVPEVPFYYNIAANSPFKKHPNDVSREIYNMQTECKYIGAYVFFAPMIVIRDPELIKSVLVKNFDHFADRKAFANEANDPLFAKNLSALNGNKWREVRNLLTPAFTSSKMKSMYVLMSNCAENFTKTFIEQYADKEEIDMKDVFTRYANDVIATCAFGIEIDSLKNPKNEFYTRGRRSTQFAGIMLLKFMLLRMFPTLCHKFGVSIISKEHTNFFVNVIQQAIKVRDDNGITRPDMLQLMMDARGKTSKELNLDTLEITAQAFLFFLGGFDTTSTQICLIAHELAANPEVQQKLQDEIDQVMNESNGKPTYEAVNNMVYLDAVFNEVLRVHSLSFVFRQCSKDFELPPPVPGGEPFTVKKGMEILVPVAGVHYDPANYDNPNKFEPERFFGKKSVISDITSLGFGLGPRMCIGNRFAILETKVLLLHLLSKCTLVPCRKTEIPFKYDPSNFAPTPKKGFLLKIKPR